MKSAGAPPTNAPERRLRAALWCAGLCVVGLAATWIIAGHVTAARLRDAAALRGFIGLDHGPVDRLGHIVLALVSPLSCSIFAIAAIVVALRRGRLGTAVAVPVILIGAVVTAETLKPLLAVQHAVIDTHHQINAASWPSGHSTAVMSMTLCALLVAPRRWRPTVAAIGGLFTLAVGFSLLTLAWHMPSDVIGGFLLAGLWVSGAVAVLCGVESHEAVEATSRQVVASRRAPRASLDSRRGRPAVEPSGGEALVPGVVLGTVLGVALAVIALRPAQVADFAAAHHSVVAFSAMITALAASLVSGFTVALKR
jgi:membrane-associated phospholipid phosphatase